MAESFNNEFEPIRVTIVTGFLGSGKTTLLNRILKDPLLSDSLVIVNEFGEVGIDHFLLESVSNDVIELSSGCLCCTIRGDMVDTLEDVAGRIKSGKISNVSRIIIETTGLADPIPIMQSFLMHPFLKSHFRLDGVIACVDLIMGLRTQIDHHEAERQISVADTIVLTKSDLIGDNSTNSQEISALITKLKSLNPSAAILDFASGKENIEKLFNYNDLNLKFKSNYDDNSINSSKQNIFSQNAEKFTSDNRTAFERNHNNRVNSYSLVTDHMMPMRSIESFMEHLTMSHGAKLLRTKGIVGVMEHPDSPVSVNGVRHVFHPLQRLDNWPDNDRRTKLVFISEEFAEPEFRKLFFAYAGISDIDTPDMAAVTENPLAIAGFSIR